MVVIGFGVLLYGKAFNFITGPIAETFDNISLYIISALFIFIMVGHVILAKRNGKISEIFIEGGYSGYSCSWTIDENKDFEVFWGTIKTWLFMIALYVIGIIFLFFLGK